MKRTCILFLACTLLLSGCVSQTPSSPVTKDEEVVEKDHTFESFLNDVVVELAESDYTTMHHYFEHPADFGIDPKKVDVTLGSILPDEKDEELEARLKKRLEEFDREKLSDLERDIYDQLEFQFDLSKRQDSEEFLYIDNIWSTVNGVPQELVNYFSEYEVREEADIQDLITLINDVPRYTKLAIEYSNEQAKRNLLRFDYDGVMENIDSVLDTKDDSAVSGELVSEIEQLGLDQDKEAKYIADVKGALEASFFPSFETMRSSLETLSSKALPLQGLANFEHGKEFYELLARSYTGSNDSIDTIKSNLESEVSKISVQLSAMVEERPQVVIEGMMLSTDFKSVDEILPFLQKNYAKSFPKLKEMEYDLQPLADEQSQNGVVAYFMHPAIDSSTKYQIRYNKRDYGDDPSSISLYQTLAHEGIPGHMYQAQYNKEHFQYTIQYFLSNLGFSEGYATYAETQALKFLDLNKNALSASGYNDLLSNYYVVLMDIAINYEGMDLNQFMEAFPMFDEEGIKGIYNQLADNPGVFLSYYYGYYLVDSLRDKAKDALKDDFDEVEFNDALLSSGSVNFEIIEKNIDSYIQEKAEA